MINKNFSSFFYNNSLFIYEEEDYPKRINFKFMIKKSIVLVHLKEI